ncbi:hypothetical protein NM208_g3787 [Fusarium decemcellulare]|uniref:Uncharacterized protein n=1 Tax=Fusarium decemcellulare TaxID=57161 RepID=A0ACC1SNA7_9HYPO|nr:hypothetical protein NM208_g3787 [Fusarium decemcellulare]
MEDASPSHPCRSREAAWASSPSVLASSLKTCQYQGFATHFARSYLARHAIAPMIDSIWPSLMGDLHGWRKPRLQSLSSAPFWCQYSHQEMVTISLAARATSAAPTYFPEVIFPEGTPKSKDAERLLFWDGGLLNNNPIDQLLGTGYTKPDSPSESWFQLVGVAAEVMDFSTNTNAKAKDFTRHMTTLNLRGEHKETKYVRLNQSLGKSQIGLADYDKMAELKKMARDYIKDERNQPWINKAVDAVCA